MSLPERIARRPGLVAAAALALTLVALWPASRVRIETDLVALLPDGSPLADDYRRFLERFGGLEKVFVVVTLDESAPPPAAAPPSDDPFADPALDPRRELMAAAERLKTRLVASPEVASARSGLEAADEDLLLRGVLPRAPLLLGDDWRDLVAPRLEPEAIRRRVGALRARLASPGGDFRALLFTADPLGFAESLPALARGPAGLPVDPLSATFLAASGDASLVVLTPARSEIDPEGGRALLAALREAFAEVGKEAATPLRFHAVGGPLYAAQDEAALREDLELTVVSSAIGCALIVVLAFGGVRIPAAAFLALGVALVWTVGWVGLVHGSITAVGIGFAAVLIGLGIDYGIHAGARFLVALRAEGSAERALVTVFRRTGPGILSSALTTAAGFATLGLAHFRPLRELGQVVAAGMVLILVAAATLGAALLVGARPPKTSRPGFLPRLLEATVTAALALARRFPRAVLAVAALLALGAVAVLPRLRVDSDPRILRPSEHPVFEAERLLSERFGLGLDTATAVVPGGDLGDALERSRAVAALLRRDLGAEADVGSPGDWLTAGEPAARRLAELATLPFARAADDLERELRAANLSPAGFAVGLEALRAFARAEDPGTAPPRERWPEWLRESLAEHGEGDAAGVDLAVRIRLPLGRWREGPPTELRQAIEAVAPGTAVASVPAIGGELRRLAIADLERLAAGGLAFVAFVVLLSFRGRPGPSLLASVPVLLGSLLAFGAWAAFDRPLDLITLAVLPILLGIGIDNGLHAVHGARLDPEAGIAGALAEAGPAMLLCSLTTAVGFGSLVLSRVPGLQNAGLLVTVGLGSCLVATLLVLPAYEAARRGR